MASNKKAFVGVGGKPRFEKPDQQKHIDSVSKNIAILTGQTKNKQDRAVLVRDLMDFGILDARGRFTGSGNTTVITGGGNGGGIVNPAPETPVKPINVRAVAAFTTIMVQWDFPNYAGHDYAEIWRNTTNTLGDMQDPRTEGEAALIATVQGSMFMDNVDYETGYYYWVRFVNTDGLVGPVHDASGVYAKTLRSTQDIIDEFQEESSQTLSDFQESFNQRIGVLDQAIITASNARDALQDEINTLDNQISLRVDVLSDAVNGVSGAVDGLAESVGLREIEIESVASDLLDEANARLEQEALIRQSIIDEANARLSELNILRESLTETQATITENHYTNIEADSAIASALSEFKTTYVDQTFATQATLANDYLTRSDTEGAISQAVSELEALTVEAAFASVASIDTNYYAKSARDLAIAGAITEFKTEFLQPNFVTKANLSLEYYTKSGVDSAISSALLELETGFTDVETLVTSVLVDSYYTKSQSDGAIAQAITNFETGYAKDNFATWSALESDYYTISDANSAISQALTTFKSTNIDGLFASQSELANNYYTKANTDEAITEALTAQETVLSDITFTALTDISQTFYAKSARDMAIARAIQEFRVDYLDANFLNTVSLTNEYYTKADADRAIAEAILTLQSDTLSKDYASTAFLVENYYTKTDADSAISGALTAFKASTLDDEYASSALLASDYYTETQTNSAISSALTAFKASTLDGEYASSALLASDYYTETQTDSAISNALTTFKANTLDGEYASSANLLANYYTKTGTDNAISSEISAFESSTVAPAIEVVNQNISTIASQRYTKTEADNAIASAISTYESETASVNYVTNSQLSSYAYTKTQTDSAIASELDTYKATVQDSSGKLTEAFAGKVTQAMVDDEGAFSTAVDKYSVTYEGNEYSIAQVTAVSVSVDGAYQSQWGVQAQVGDLQHGVGFLDDNGTTTFMVSTDNFAVFNPVDGEWEAVFGVRDGRVVITDAVIGDAILQTLAVQFKATFEGEVIVNGELDAWKLKGAQITGNALWMVNGNHSLAIEPDDYIAVWFGEAVYYNVETDTDARALGNAKFALTNTGEIIARGMELYDNDNNLIMDADGVDGVYIKDLSVDTLKIKGNAITVKSYYETSSVSVAGGEESFLYSSDHAHGGKESNGSLLVTVIIQSSLTSTAPGGGDINFTAEILDSADDSVIQSQLRLGVKSTYVGVPEFTTMVLFAGNVDADNVYIRVKAESDRNSHLVAMRVVVDSAKR